MKNSLSYSFRHSLAMKSLVFKLMASFVFLFCCTTVSNAQSTTPASSTQSSTPPPATQPGTPSTESPTTQPVPTPGQLESDANAAGYSMEQLKQLGIDPAKPDQAIQRARELGIPESQIQGYLNQYGTTQQDNQVQDPLGAVGDEATKNESSVEEASQGEDETKDLLGDELKLDGTNQEEELVEGNAVSDFAGQGRFAGLNYIGYKTFNSSTGQIGSMGVGPIDPGYTIGKGDVIRIYVWGEQQFQYEFTVGANGNIVVPNVGPIFVAGIRYADLQDKLRRSLSRFYSTLTMTPPRSFIEVSLAQLRPKNIYLMGDVSDPRTYQISSYATVFNLIYITGGPTVHGSLRDVRVIREDKVIANVDLYSSLIKGQNIQDVRLLENDLVFVPPRGKTVGIEGPIPRPGIYELKSGETLKELIEFAGKLSPGTYGFRAQIDRIVPIDERSKQQDDRLLIDVNLSDVLSGKKKVQLVDGDRVTLFPYSDQLTQFVSITGMGVARPGVYELGAISRLRDLVLAADSLSGDAYLAKADIRRVQPDGTETFLSIDLLKAMQKDPANNVVLWPQDQVRVYSQSEWRQPRTIQLGGYVAMPGVYPLAENQTLYDLLFTHSGLQDSLRYSRTHLERGDLLRLQPDGKLYKIVNFSPSDVWSKVPGSNFTLRPGDRVVIFEKNRFQPEPTITLQGHVKNPGKYLFMDNLTLGDLIFLHSGFEDSVFYARTYTKRVDIFRMNADGRTRRTLSYSLTEVWEGKEAGSTLLLPEDIIQVYSQSIMEIEAKTVTLAGAVNTPGKYRLRENMTLADLLLLGDGFTQDAWLFEAELTRFDLIDLPGDSIAITRRIPLELSELDNRKPEDIVRNVIEHSDHLKTFFLQPMDRITILNNPEYRPARNVTISGEIKFPGEYSLQLLDERLSDLIRRAGGVTSIAHLRGAKLVRKDERLNIDFYELVKKKNKKEDIILLPGDVIVIPEEPGTVQLSGLVYNPGLYKYRSGKRVKTYIKEAGGILEDSGDMFITYASGRSLKVDFWHNPRVYDGSKIEVRPIPVKPDEDKGEPLDITAVTKEFMTLIASALTIIVLATRLN